MKQAMILAAGLGTRLKPMTDTMPKAMVRVEGKPLLWYILMKLKSAGFGHVVVNIHHFGDQIVDYLAANQNFGLDIRISDERAELLNTGGALKKALPLFSTESPVLIHNVDIFSNVDVAKLYDAAIERDADALLVVGERKTCRYLLFDDEMLLAGWANVDQGLLRIADPSLSADSLRRLPFTGIHTIHPRLAAEMATMPDKFGVFDFYMKFCRQHRFEGYLKSDLRMLDVGKLDTLGEAERFLQLI